jgi:hypothetical protein
LSGRASFAEFLNERSGPASWCRDKLDYADRLFDELHQLEANGQPTRHRVLCDSERSRLVGNIGQMLSQLRSLLTRPEVVKGPVRRLISNWHLGALSQAGKVESKDMREAYALSTENLDNNPASIRDLRNWLRAYRMMPDFAFSVAIDRITRSSLVSDDIDPLYYLMVINFMAHRVGIASGLSEARKYLESCLSGCLTKGRSL